MIEDRVKLDVIAVGLKTRKGTIDKISFVRHLQEKCMSKVQKLYFAFDRG